MIWILIMIGSMSISGYVNGEGVTASTAVEFSSQKACEKARALVSWNVFAVCVEK